MLAASSLRSKKLGAVETISLDDLTLWYNSPSPKDCLFTTNQISPWKVPAIRRLYRTTINNYGYAFKFRFPHFLSATEGQFLSFP